jgi:hypothetical protein
MKLERARCQSHHAGMTNHRRERLGYGRSPLGIMRIARRRMAMRRHGEAAMAAFAKSWRRE